MPSISRLLIALTIIFLTTGNLYADDLSGKIVGVHDGDTATLLTAANEQIKIRLAQIDAPELDQPFGQSSKQALSKLIFGKDVAVKSITEDKYKRSVGTIFVGITDINLEMVEQGNAWAYRSYLKNDNILKAEEVAKFSKKGLWGLQQDQITPPWEWRRGTNSGKIPSEIGLQRKIQVYPKSGCTGKRFCKEMSSCEEAKFYLNNCGLTKLDGDHDGTPCEAICR